MSAVYQKKSGWYGRQVMALLLFILAADRALALDPNKSVYQFNCQNWNRQSGLPSDKINAITQTKDGFMWFGTQNGLVRFDGFEFKSFHIAGPQSGGLEIKSMVARNRGGLWLAISGGGFYNFYDQKFTPVEAVTPDQSKPSANAVLESRTGMLWGGTDTGLARWVNDHPEGNLFETMIPLVTALAEDPAGRIWAGTAEHGLWYWTNGKGTPVLDSTLTERNLYALATDRDGRIWVGSGKGLLCYNVDGKVNSIPEVGSEVRALLLDRHGTLWIGTSGEGLVRYQNGIFTHLNKVDGLISDYITSIFEDAEGSLWVGTRDGLSQLTDLKFPNYSDREGLPEGSATSVTASRRGGLWITTASGLCYFDGTNSVNYTNNPNLNPFYLKLGTEARNGDFYMVDGNKDIDVFSGGNITTVATNRIWVDALGEDAKSVLVGVGSGLFRIQDGKLKPYQYQAGQQPLFYWINNILVARDGAIWVISNNGIFRIWQGTVKHWLGEHGNSLYEDEEGTIWAGMEDGIARIKDGKVKRIRAEDGIFDDRIYSIIPDDRGYLWFDSGNGIFRITRKALGEFADGESAKVECEAFAGLDSVKFTDRVDQEPSGCKTADGRIWFPNPHGVVMIDPGHYFTNRIAPRVAIQQILLNGNAIKDRRAPVFHVGDKQVQFFFSALSYLAPKKMRVQYQLIGLDSGWIEAGLRRNAIYSDLKPGDYTFKIRACNADGIWNESGDSFSLTLPVPIYQTAWFKSACVMMAILILLGAYRWKLRLIEHHRQKLQAEKDLLEAKVAGRTAELTREIMERRQTEEQLRKSQSQLAQAQQIAHMGSWEWDLAADQVFWSKETQALYGRNPSDAELTMEACIVDRIHSEDRLRVNQTIAESLQARQPFVCDHRVILPDGQERVMQWRGEVLLNGQGEPAKMIGIVQDITQTKRAQEALQRSEDQLRQAQKMEAVGRLAGGVAHDFNNLLTVIDGYCAMALRKEEEVRPIRKNLEEIQKAAGRAASLTNQLLAFSRKQVLQPKVLQLNEVVGGMEKMLRRLIGEDIELSTVYDPLLGNTHADPGQIEQVIMNLAVNARDAMPRGGRLAIKTSNVAIDHKTSSRNRTLEAGEYVMISISDDGVGMTDDVQSHLFEPFYTTKGLGKGTGLGLATCYGIICQSGGDIRVYSEPNSGTTFKIYLPRTDARLAAKVASPREYMSTGTESILVVEDDTAVRVLAVTILRDCGYQVQESSNAFDALALLKRNPDFDLVVSDVIMPQMSGKDLLDAIKNQLPDVKVLLMSGYTDDALAHRGVLDEGLSFLEKPFSPAKLAKKVREVLDTPQPHQSSHHAVRVTV